MDLGTFLGAFSDGFMREDARINNAKAAVAEERRKAQEQFLRDQLTYQKAIDVATLGSRSREKIAEENRRFQSAKQKESQIFDLLLRDVDRENLLARDKQRQDFEYSFEDKKQNNRLELEELNIQAEKDKLKSQLEAKEINDRNAYIAEEAKEKEQQMTVYAAARSISGVLYEEPTEFQIQSVATGLNNYQGGLASFTKDFSKVPKEQWDGFLRPISILGAEILMNTSLPNIGDIPSDALRKFRDSGVVNATPQQTTKIQLNESKDLDTGQKVVFRNVQSAWDANQVNILNSAAKNNINDGGKVNIPTITSAAQRITDAFNQRRPVNKLSSSELEKQYLQDSSQNKQNAFGFLDSYATSISSTFDSATTDFQRAGVANKDIQKLYDDLFQFNFSTPENTKQFLTTLGLGNVDLIKNSDIRNKYVERIYRMLKTKTRVKN